MYKIGLSTTGEKLCEETIKEYAKSGIEFIEISAGKKEIDLINYDDLKMWADTYGVKIWSFHLPFYPFDELDISNDKLADYTVKYLTDISKRRANRGKRQTVAHGMRKK